METNVDTPKVPSLAVLAAKACMPLECAEQIVLAAKALCRPKIALEPELIRIESDEDPGGDGTAAENGPRELMRVGYRIEMEGSMSLHFVTWLDGPKEYAKWLYFTKKLEKGTWSEFSFDGGARDRILYAIHDQTITIGAIIHLDVPTATFLPIARQVADRIKQRYPDGFEDIHARDLQRRGSPRLIRKP